MVSFAVHNELICHHTPFFQAATNGCWVEARSGIVKLPEHEPKAFEVFEHWLYISYLGTNVSAMYAIGGGMTAR